MRKLVFTILLIFFITESRAQKSYTDSLLNIITFSNDVQTRVEAGRHYTWHYAFKGYDSVNYCADRLLKIGEEKKYDDIMSMGKGFKGYAMTLISDTYKALTYDIDALKLAEKIQNDFLFAFIYIGYGNLYSPFNNAKSMEYYRKTLQFLNAGNSPAINSMRRSVLTNLGNRYNLQKQYDSAFVCLKKAEEITILLNDTSQSSGNLYRNLGTTYLGLGQPKLAYAYFKLSLENAQRLSEDRNKRLAYTALAKYHKTMGETDSALHYLNMAHSGLDFNKPGNWYTESPLMLYELYKTKGNDREALKNLEIYRNSQLKIDSARQLQQVQALSFEEDQRQKEVEQAKGKEKEERKHNLQYAAIALGIIIFLTLFFVLSHSVLAKPRLIKFLGILALLFVFEFINLFIHPYLDKWTNHSAPMMLAIMVCIAALLIPLHHKLEHWVTHKMVEKNKKIRLAAAKKTIEQLERSTDAQHHL